MRDDPDLLVLESVALASVQADDRGDPAAVELVVEQLRLPLHLAQLLVPIGAELRLDQEDATRSGGDVVDVAAPERLNVVE